MNYNSEKKIEQETKLSIALSSGYTYEFGGYYKNGVLIQDIDAELTRVYISKLGKIISPTTLTELKDNIKNLNNKTSYDFENVPYKTYVKRIAATQNLKEMKDMKEKYAVYLESIRDRKSTKQVFYLQGTAGAGKSTYAKILGKKYYGEDDVFISASSDNLFDNYNGERVIILDDLRDSDMRYSRLLKLLDNNTSSDIGARYHDKNLARCEIIIITSTISPMDMYKGIEEERFQLYRRIKFLRLDEGFLELYNYNREADKYVKVNEKNVQQELEQYYKEHPNENNLKIDDLFEVSKTDLKLEDINEDDLPF